MHPILLKLGPVTIHSYGVMLVIGYAMGVWVSTSAAKRLPKAGINPSDLFDVALWMLMSGIFFARVVFVLLDPNLHQYTLGQALAIWDGGISFDGGLFGAVLAVIVFCRLRKIAFMNIADFIVPGGTMGYAIGRIGCFLNGCCYGRPTNLPWGVRFQINEGVGQALWSAPSHPTQLYSAALSLVLLAVLLWKLKRGRDFPGQVFCWYMMGSSIERFIMEIWRAGVTSDYVRGTGLTTAQFFCIFLFTLGLGIMIFLKYRNQSGDNVSAAVPQEAISG